ncbi:MAG: PhnD/SsuA/transferrin family substrate-binding protein [Caldimicrobium sp.]|nr:PhnD/SsuA/transferrin family substrate-binding protein [Caldimicrobium sp.]MDW8095066.1 PhnD/SsuA/transferrin family substrate-binding protein [Caldimicrobium sp.]
MLRYFALYLWGFIFWSVITYPNPCLGETIKFTPIPNQPREVLVGNYYPLIEYLKKKTGLNIVFHYESSYQKMLEDFKAEKIHIITTGPLPYVLLKREYPHAEAILHIKERDGSTFYRCVLFTSAQGPDSIKKLKGPIALPQRISTCGYFSASIILSGEGKSLEKLGYTFFDNQYEIAEEVLKGTHEAGCLKEDIAMQYKGFAIKILKHSPPWPAFSIVVNRKILSPEVIDKIKSALLNMSPEDTKKLNVGKYGFAQVKEKDFDIIKKYEKHIPKN